MPTPRCAPTLAAGNYGRPGRRRRDQGAGGADCVSAPMRRSRSMRGACPGSSPTTSADREATVSIWTTHGRFKGMRILAAPRDLVLLRTRPIGETDLICRDGKWFLYATVEAPEAPLTEPAQWVPSAWIWGSSTSPPPATVIAHPARGSTATANARRGCESGCRPRKPARRGGC